MGLTDADKQKAAQRPASITLARSGPQRVSSEVEAEIGQLYLGTMDEPVPHRLLTVLRAAVCASKA